MTGISAWLGSGAGIITIGLCVIAGRHLQHLPSFLHPWAHRFLIVAEYAGATAVLATAFGLWALGLATRVAGWFGGFGTGLGKVAIVLAGLFLLLAVGVALVRAPALGAASLAVILAFVLALEPGGFLHQFWVVTSAPGRQFAAQVAAWLGG